MATHRRELRKTTAKIGLCAVLVLATATLSPGQIYFGISPIRAEHRLNPGESLTEVFEDPEQCSGAHPAESLR